MKRRAESAPTPPRTRRALLAGALGGIAAWAAATAARADPVAAAAGDPIRMGQHNNAGETSTTLQTDSQGPALQIAQLSGSSSVRAEATSGRAVQAIAGPDGTGVWAYSPDHYGVRTHSDTGVALYCSTGSGTALVALGGIAASGSPQGYAGIFTSKVLMQQSLDIHPAGTPGAPDDGARLFVRTNVVSGKQELCVRFATGDPIVLGTQP